MIGYGKQNITKEDLLQVERVLKSDYLTQGPEVEAFEKEFSSYVGSKYAVAVSNGTAALQLIARTLKYIYPYLNTVQVPDITFVADANAFYHEGYQIDLVDIQYNTPLVRFGDASVIVPVDMCGFPWVPDEDLGHDFIIRDACHSLGAEWKRANTWHKVGNCTWADFTVFSFHPVKHITTGEGGMITTNNLEYANTLRKFRNHGFDLIDNKYKLSTPGFNYRMSDIQAALGRSQLKRIDQFVARRREIASMYTEAFKDIDAITLPHWFSYKQRPSWHLYPILINNRDEVRKALFDRGIGTQIHYQPIHRFDAYRRPDYKYYDSIQWYEREVSLPMYADLTNTQVNDIIETLKEVLVNA
jgi:perosamine synthetase